MDFKIGDLVSLEAVVTDVLPTHVLTRAANGVEYWFHHAAVKVVGSQQPQTYVPAVAPETSPEIEAAVAHLMSSGGYNEKSARAVVEQIGPKSAMLFSSGDPEIQAPPTEPVPQTPPEPAPPSPPEPPTESSQSAGN